MFMHRLVAAAIALLPAFAFAQTTPLLSLELNKLEPAAAGAPVGCTAYLVAADPEGGPKIDALRLDLVLFGTDGVIVRRLALDIGAMQPGRMQVRPFELRDLACDAIGQILVNDALICKIGGADQTDCLDKLRTGTRVATKLVK